MEQKMFLRSYCLLGLGNIEEIKEDLSVISESSVNYVSGKDMLITTFTTTFKIAELENFLKIHERTFIMFEMTPGFFSAALNNDEFQRALFGGDIDNSQFDTSFIMEDSMKGFMEALKQEVEEEEFRFERKTTPTPTLDELLDKIGDKGIENLSTTEKNILNNYSKQKK